MQEKYMMISLTVGQFAALSALPMVTFVLGMYMMPGSSSAPQVREAEQQPSTSKRVHRRIDLLVAAQPVQAVHEDLEPEPACV
jgi:hypothetical protein